MNADHVTTVSDVGQDNGKERRKALVEREIIDQACRLFAEKGYSGTTLTDIADAVGLTRAAIYYYFKNKESLLETIVDEVTSAPMREIAEWSRTASEDICERLRSFVSMRIKGVLQRQPQMRVIELAEAALPPDLLKRHTEAKRRILSEYRSILQDGMKRGAFRAQDDRVAAFGIIGMVNWTTSWFAPGRARDVEEIATQLAEMAVQAVTMPQSRQDGFTDVRTAVETLRSDLDQLALLIDGN